MYRALEHFRDLQDNGYSYDTGDIFPREGLTVDQARLDELASDKNRRHRPMIELLVEESPKEVEKEPTVDFTPEPKEPVVETEKPSKPVGRRKRKNAD